MQCDVWFSGCVVVFSFNVRSPVCTCVGVCRVCLTNNRNATYFCGVRVWFLSSLVFDMDVLDKGVFCSC